MSMSRDGRWIPRPDSEKSALISWSNTAGISNPSLTKLGTAPHRNINTIIYYNIYIIVFQTINTILYIVSKPCWMIQILIKEACVKHCEIPSGIIWGCVLMPWKSRVFVSWLRNGQFLLSKRSCWLALANSGSVTGFQISTLESVGINNRCCALKSVMPRRRYVVVGGIVSTPGIPWLHSHCAWWVGPHWLVNCCRHLVQELPVKGKALHPISLWDKCNAAAAENENRNLGRWRLLLVGELADSLKIGTCMGLLCYWICKQTKPRFLCPLGMKKIKKHQPCHFPLLIWHNSSLRFQPTVNQRFRWVWGTLCFIVHGTGIPKPVNVKLHIQLDGKKQGQTSWISLKCSFNCQWKSNSFKFYLHVV